MFAGFLTDFYGISRSFFIILKEFLGISDVAFPRYNTKRVFAGFEIGFMAFAIPFLALLRFFCVDRKYRCKNISKNVYFAALKTGICRYFLPLWRIFCVDERYCFLDKAKHLCLVALKLV